VTKHQTLDRLVEEATIKPLSATLQRLPPETEAEIICIVQSEVERAVAPLRAMLQELVDEKRARSLAAAEAAAARERSRAMYHQAQAQMTSLAREVDAEIDALLRDCTPAGGRAGFFNRIRRRP